MKVCAPDKPHGMFQHHPGRLGRFIKQIGLRGFDRAHIIVVADVVDGRTLIERVPAAFSDPDVADIHLHIAKPGCFAASVTRTNA